MTATLGQTAARSGQVNFQSFRHGTTVQHVKGYRFQASQKHIIIFVESVEDGRRQGRSLELKQRADAKAHASAESLLEELATDRGLGWHQISHLCGVSVQTVRKWRNGGHISVGSRKDMAQLAAFLDILEESSLKVHPAGWLYVRLLESHTVRAADLYVDGHADDLLEHAQGLLTTNDLLDKWSPDWRTERQSHWKLVDLPDSERVLTRRQ